MSDTHHHEPPPPPQPPLPAAPPAQGGAPQPGIVNVIFRGAFVFVGRPRMIEVLVPNLGAEHVYRAGPFLGELNLPARAITNPYVLEGVKTGEGKFDKSNMIFKGFDYDPASTPAQAFCRIVVPRPKEILAFRPVKEPLNTTRDPLGLIAGQRPFGFHVFRYDADDLKKVLFHSEAHTPGIHPVGLAGFINLHLIAEPERGLGMEHVTHAFDTALGLFPALRGVITLGKTETAYQPLDKPIPPELGFCAAEIETIEESADRTINFGLELRNPDHQEPAQSVGRAPQSCLSLIADIESSL